MATVVKSAVVSKAVEVAPDVPTLAPLAKAIDNNTKPILTGTGVKGTTVTIMDGTTKLGTATVDANGFWSFSVATALADGIHQFSVKASLTPTSTVFSSSTAAAAYTLDTKPPAVPVITTNTALTNNGKITLAGTAEANSSVKIMDGTVLVTTVKASASGAWSYTPPASAAAYADGLHSFTVTATDAVGNVSLPSKASAITIDTVPPTPPTVITAFPLTNNFKPVLTGTAEIKSTVTIYDGGVALGTAIADATGKWTFTPTKDFSEGAHAITVRATDAAGNKSDASPVYNVVTTSKILKEWGGVETLAGQDGKSQTLRPNVAGFNGDKVWTEVSAPTARWTSPGYIPVSVTLQSQDRLGGLSAGDKQDIAVATVYNRGFGVMASSNLYHADPTNSSKILGGVWWLDAGNTSASNYSPNTYTLNYKSFAFNSFANSTNGGSFTDISDSPPLLTGIDLSKQSSDKNFNYNWAFTTNGFAFEWDELLSGSTTQKVANIALFDVNGTQIGDTDTSAPMNVGVLTNLGTDPYGNYDFLTLDRTADVPSFTLTTISNDGQNSSSHSMAVNFAKNMATTNSGAITWVYSNKDTTGNYLNIEFALSGIRNGRSVIDFIQTDTDLKVKNTVTVDIAPETNPDNAVNRIRQVRLPDTNTTIFGYQTGVNLHLVELDATGTIIQDFTKTLGTNIIFDRLTSLNDGRIEISLLTKGATTSAATLVQTQIFDTRTSALNVTSGSGLVAGTVLSDTIAMTSANAVVEGGSGADKLSATGVNSTLSYEHSLASVQVNLASKTAAGGDATGDTISGFSNLVGSQFDDTLTGDTNNNIFTGALGNDTIIGGGGIDTAIYSGNQADYTIKMNTDGSYTITDNRDGSPDGIDTVKAVAKLSFFDKVFSTIDPTKAPVIKTQLTLTNLPFSPISGTAIAGSKVSLFDGAAIVGTTTADTNGNWSVTPQTKLSEGTHNLIAKTVDSGGNLSLSSNALSFVVDTIAPTKPVFALDVASDTGVSATDKITSLKTPKIAGTAEAGSTVTLFEGTTVLGTATVGAGSAGGAFTITSGTLTDGEHTLTVQAKDAAGNVSLLSDALKVTIDTKTPDAPILDKLGSVFDTGLSAIDGITNIAIPVITGTAEAGSKVELFDGTKSVGTATVGVAGKYSITPAKLLDGAHILTVKSTDVAGNTSLASTTLTITTDTVGPALPLITSKAGPINNNAPTISGTAEANATVTIFKNTTAVGSVSTAIGSVTADATGKWSYTVTNLLADGVYQFSAQATDVAGNMSGKTASISITVDTVAPDKPISVALTAASDTGVSATDGITKINTPTVTGTAEAGSTVTLYEGSTALGTALAGSTGAFSITSSKLVDGNHVLSAKAVDAAGNESLLSASINVFVVTAVPDAPVIKTTGATSTATPTITGTAKPLTTVTVNDGTLILGTAIVDMQGAWSFLVPDNVKLSEGSHNLTATSSDNAGNVSNPSAVAALTVNLKPIEVTIDQLSKYAGSTNVGSFSVKDTAANIAKNLDVLAATPTLYQVIQTDTPKSIEITATQYNADLAVFAKFRSNFNLIVSGVTIADADKLQSDNRVMSFQISDTISNVKSNFELLNAKFDMAKVGSWKNINTIAPIVFKDSGNIVLTSAQYIANTTIKAFLPASTMYEISDVQTDSAGLTLSKNSNIAIITVADTVAAITADLDKLNAAVNIKSISFTDATPPALIISYTQLGTDVAALAKLPANYQLVVKDVPAAQIATVSANTHVISMSVVDSTANLLSLINADSKGINGTVVNPKISTITIDETKPAAAGGASSTSAGISIADAMKIAALPNLAAVPSFMILDTAANIIAHARYDILNVIAHSNKITISDLPPKLTVADAKLLNGFSAFQISNASMTVAGSAGGAVTLTSGTLTPIATSAGGSFTLTSGSVTGTVTATGSAGSFTISSGTLTQAGKALTISSGSMTVVPPSRVDASGNPLITGFTYTLSDANTTLLDAANADLVKAAKSVAAIHTYTVADALKLQAPVLLTTPIAIDDTAANIIAQSKVTGDMVISRAIFVIVTDTMARVAAAIDDLELMAKKGKVTDIKVTDTVAISSLTVAQLANDYDAIGRILSLNMSTSNATQAYTAPTLIAPTLTNIKQPTITGSAKPGATVNIYDGSTLLGSAIADSMGLWTYKVATNLTESTHTLTAKASMADGTRMSVASNAVAMLVDATAPSAPTLVLPNLTVSGLTKNALPTLSGTAENASSVSIYDGTTLVATVNANATTGAWTYTFTKALTDGAHNLKAIATDAAGNVSAASSISTLTVDTVAPTAPTVSVATGASGSENTKPKISGTAEKGSTVTVYDGSALLGTTTASNTDGTWSLTLSANLAIGVHTITAKAQDAATNLSTASTAAAWTVPDPTPQPVVTSLKWSADQLNGYEFSATTGNKTSSSATVSETVSLVAGATYTFAAGYGYSYSGSAPTVSIKVLDASNTLVGSTSTPVNGYTFKAATTGVYTVQLAAINGTNTAQLTSYNLSGHQAMSTMPSTSGDTNVDALLMGGSGQWWHTAGSLATVSTAPSDVIHPGLSSLTAASAQHTLTYSFLTSLPATASASDKLGFAAMSAIQQAAVKKALDYISTLIDVKFTLATTAGQGDINFGQNNQSGSAGYAYLPYQGGGNPSYLMLASNASTNADFSVGGYGWETLIHEIGHTLGLKHPGNYNAGGGGTPGPYLPTATDTRRYTIMSYNNPTDSTNVTAKAVTGGTSYSWTSINPQSFMLYDIEALQYLYGSNEATAYQTVAFAADYKGMQTIWAPSGGKIDTSAMSLSSIIDLRGGYFSSIGIQGPSTLPAGIAGYQTYTGMNNVAIAYGSSINDAVGGTGNDVFYVNANNDTIDGGTGTDVVYLYGSAGDWTISGSSTLQTAINKNSNVTQTLKNIETISYYDPTVVTPTHTAPAGMLSQSVSAFVQSVAAMAGQGSASTIIPTNGGMTLQQVMSVTKPV